jgi:hypothetical protein
MAAAAHKKDVRAWVSEGGSLTQAAEHPSGSRVSGRFAGVAPDTT